MKKQNGFLKIPILIGIIVIIVILSGTGYFIIHKKQTAKDLQADTTNNLIDTNTIDPNTSENIEIEKLKKEIEDLKNKSSNNQNVTSGVTQSVGTPMDVGSTRAMIAVKYRQTVNDVKAYLLKTYPDYESLNKECFSCSKCVLMDPYNSECRECLNSSRCSTTWPTQRSEISSYVNKTFNDIVDNYCKMNNTIISMGQEDYCYSIFKRTTTETRQKFADDLKPWW